VAATKLVYKIAFPLLLLLYFANISKISAEQWLYVNPVKPMQTISIEKAPDSFGINDVHHEAKFCIDSSDYICVTTKDFQFYVPRNISDKIDEWKTGGVIYKSKRLERYNILGMQEPIFHIHKIEGEGIVVFLYSKKRGLIGLGGFKSDSTGFYILAQSCGFGASKDCTMVK
jgi:hypothetical protein